ncbi:transcription initiation factor TFIID subunit 8 [Nematocida major]|uniref:transcription initiation factor TFIID subunit 8 n=1 Tax=Nematocida major TaxID=1912982 RepID=UPI0020083A80|nr:transcription initiation factor TFIID subunit 8 [Nematocida major]KAH9385527.1 transcription initiation factor TFIID subunit 8 [Nematocida major]
MESIKKTLQAVISALLKEEGFEKIEARAMESLSTAFFNYAIYTSSRLKRQCEMSRRTLPTLVDAAIMVQEMSNQREKQKKDEGWKIEGIELETLSETLNKYNENSTNPVQVNMEDSFEEEKEFASEACAYVEYPQNYYEFLPKFPPAHTFKTSTIKRKITDDRAQKARLRNEQTKKVVENLFSIMEKSGKTPKYANYLM